MVTVLIVEREWTVVMMSRYIDADILLEIIEGLTWYHPVQGKMVEGAKGTGWYKSDDVFRAVEECARLELSDILKGAYICGYDFKDLVTFADACKRQGITEQDMSDFCKNAGDAYRYVLDMVQEQTNKAVTEMAMNCGIKGGDEYERE